MNIIFLSLVDIDSIQERGIYPDLLRKFHNEGHDITIVTPRERRRGIETSIVETDRLSILKVKTLNIQKTNILEKGIGTLAIEFQFLIAIKKYLKNKKFDLVLYATPPITLVKVIEYIKKRDNAYSYLLLKDIFPQNAIDMKMLKEGSFIHKQFVKKEKKLYQISDTIGCMSPANVDFVLRHNPEVANNKVEINPNSIEIKYFKELSLDEKSELKSKYRIPQERKIFIYGGNLGKPQGIDFLIETLNSKKDDKEIFFVVVGSGTEYGKIQKWIHQQNPENVLLISALPKMEYDKLLRACDVGLIFLHKDFKIPNYPSRLLSYLEFKMPVLAATDMNTDVGSDLVKNNCGLAAHSGNLKEMTNTIDSFKLMGENEFEIMRNNSFKFLENNFQVHHSYTKIISSIQ